MFHCHNAPGISPQEITSDRLNQDPSCGHMRQDGCDESNNDYEEYGGARLEETRGGSAIVSLE